MPSELVASDIVFAYEAPTRVLDGVSVSIVPGTMTGIVGPNGAGKSTLLRILADQVRPQKGSVSLGEKPLAALGRVERARRVAYLPQMVEPVFALSVYEVVMLGRFPHIGGLRAPGLADHAVIARCLAETETTALQARAFTTLSGGERQRTLLASILAQEPEILLLDEPTSALDLHHQHEVFVRLRRLAREGYGVGIVTHDLNAAARFCDGLCLLGSDGCLLASGTPAAVLTENTLARAYGPGVRVCPHPLTGLPLVTMGEVVEAPA